VAISHFRIKGGSKAKGASGRENFRYLCREGKYQQRNDLVEVVHQNYPAWAKEDPKQFWQAADIYERANARVYTELEIALPRELSPSQQLKLVNDFAQQEIGDRHPYTLAIHCPLALDGGRNPHFHLMMTERSLADGVVRDKKTFFKRANSKYPERGGAAKDPDWNRREKVNELRASWGQAVNLSLKRAGIDAVINMKSLAEQGIERIPEPKLGAAQTAMLRQGKHNDNTLLVQSLRTIRNIEGSLGGVQKEINQEIRHLAQAVVHNSPLFIPANEIKSEVRDKKLELYEKLREVESQRYKLGLLHTASGGVYQKSANPEVNQKRAEVEKQFSTLNNQLAKTKIFEKNLRLLGDMPIAMEKDKPISDEESLYDRPGFMQKLEKAKQQQKEQELSNQMQLQREPPPSMSPP